MVCASVHAQGPQRGKLLRVYPQVRGGLWGVLDASAAGRQGGVWMSPGRAEGTGRVAKVALMSSQLAPCTPAPKKVCMCRCRYHHVASPHLHWECMSI